MTTSNILLLLSESVVYFGVIAILLHGRNRYGLGIFVCALGVRHFLETYLAAVFYIQLPFGTISPGSTVLFSGKLMMILLLGFFAARNTNVGLIGGWVAKIAAAVVYSFMIEAYLRWFDEELVSVRAMSIKGVLETLTYRERYERLLQESGRDSLTGVLDRRRLDRDSLQLFSRAKKEGSTFSLIAIDLDDFKSINDTYGHQTGDRVLHPQDAGVYAQGRSFLPVWR